MHREEWGVLNYGQRGRRGFKGRSVNSIQMDSEGLLTAYYSEAPLEEVIGKIPSGPQGEPGENGRIIDVFVNSESVVDSEGKAYITLPEPGQSYVAGENITIDGNIISAVDTKYTAGDNIEISASNVISSPMLIDKALTVGLDIGGYFEGDTIPADTPIRDIIEKLLCPEPRPVPPTENLLFWGVGGSRREAPTGIDSTMASEVIDPQEVQRYGVEKHYVTNAQWSIIAFPVDMPDLVYAEDNDTGSNSISLWQKSTVEYGGKQYKFYCQGPTKSSDTKWVFKWRM